jgi:hypothetical protein
MSFNKQVAPFTDDYREKCFEAWFLAGCPVVTRTQGILPDFEDGRRPSESTIASWMESNDWMGRAALLNQQALAKVDIALVQTKAELLKQQFETAVALAKKASENLLEGIDNSNAAVQLYFKATAEARNVMGIAEAFEKIGEMSNEQLQNAIAEMLERSAITDPIPEEEETNVIEEAKMNAHTQTP